MLRRMSRRAFIEAGDRRIPRRPGRARFGAGRLGGVLCACLAALSAPGQSAECPTFHPGSVEGYLEYPGITELSGLAASRRHAGVLWAHNDSGDAPRLYATTTAGAHLGVYEVSGAHAVDWEDMAIGPGLPDGPDSIFIGDIGDNTRSRSSIVVYRVAEPAVSPGQEPGVFAIGSVDAFPLRYPEGARYDAETLMADPLSGDLFIATKDSGGTSRVFRCSAPLEPGVLRTLEDAGTLVFGTPALPSADRALTAGDIAPSGGEILLRTYSSAHLWTRIAGEPVSAALSRPACSVPLRIDFLWWQGEAIAFAADGFDYLTASEGQGAPIIRYRRERPMRVAAIRLAAGNGLTLDVDAAGAAADALGVEGADMPGPGAVWATEPDVRIEPLAPGIFRVAVPTVVGDRRFYRVGLNR